MTRAQPQAPAPQERLKPPKEPAASFEFYPQYCFHLSPTLARWCFLRVADVARLTRFADFEGVSLCISEEIRAMLTAGQNIYFYANLPIKWVRVVGLVVSCSEFFGKQVYTVDDGSGRTLECVERGGKSEGEKKTEAMGAEIAGADANTGANAGAVTHTSTRSISDLTGQVVDFRGELRPFRNELQLQIVRSACVRSTEDEVQLWAKQQAFSADVLARPWTLSRQQVRLCRREALNEAGRG